MLMLTRFQDESITLTTQEGRITIILVEVCKNGKVRLGVDAPKSIEVHRTEIQMRIDKEKGIANGVVTNLSS